MGKKRGGGGNNGGGSDQLLRRRIEAAGKKYSTIEQLVDHLRSSYPLYARHKLRPFTKQIERVTMFSSRSNDTVEDSNGDGDTPTAIKRRRIDNKEEKLPLMEYEQLRCTNNVSGSGCSSSSLASASYSVDNSDSSYEEGFKDLILMNEKSKLRDKKVIPLSKHYNSGKGVNYSSGKGVNVINGPMFKDFGGINGVIELLKMDVIVPLLHPQLLCHLGVKPMSGILFYGPPGCGKTKLAHAIANEAGVSFYKMCATELVTGVSGASEENIRKVFSEAHRTSPSIVFIDEIDAIASKRDDLHREMEKRIVTQLLTSMDESHVPVKPAVDDGNYDCRPGYVLVIAATNRPNAVDPALRRPGRFDREIPLGLPDEAARIEILSALIQSLRVEGALDIQKIAKSTPGFSGADLTALAQEAGKLVIKRNVHARRVELSKAAAAREEEDWELSEEWLRRPWSVEEVGNLSITMTDFEEAAKTVQPSSGREGFSKIPDVKWDDVGGLHLLRQEFHSNIIRRIKFPEVYENFGVDIAIGFLLYGPPGCGKTLIAKAVANEARASFIHIKGPELLDKYLGGSELKVRDIFCRARTCSPCIIFFDEVDALTRKRGRGEEGGCVERVLNQLLIELDGSEQRRGVYVIGATNRLEVMDDALLRPGRFGNVMYVPLPTPDERGMILKALARNKRIDANVDLVALGKDSRCDNFSGADLSALVNGAGMAAVEDHFSSINSSSASTIKDAHFTMALEKISPSVTDEQRQHYQHKWESYGDGMRA